MKNQKELLEAIRLIQRALYEVRRDHDIPLGVHEHLDAARESIRVAGSLLIQE